MRESTQDSIVLQTIALLSYYSFEIKEKPPDRIVEKWLEQYTPLWLRLATIEALYLGRYKAVSVEHILTSWLRKGNPSYHFNHDFERLICRRLPEYLRNIDLDTYQYNSEIEGENSKKPIQFSQPIIQAIEKKSESSPLASQSKFKKLLLTLEEKNDAIAAKNKDKNSEKPVVAYQPNWISTSTVQKSIERFTPLPDRSKFYLKLKAVAKQSLK
ncbi:MAG: hypothetical protein ACFBSE_08785 [Prochloraceae cyanobacterium]